jgi:hypothetical protein
MSKFKYIIYPENIYTFSIVDESHEGACIDVEILGSAIIDRIKIDYLAGLLGDQDSGVG